MGILSGYYQRWQARRRKRNEARAEAQKSLQNEPSHSIDQRYDAGQWGSH